jgi:hypothetical protein
MAKMNQYIGIQIHQNYNRLETNTLIIDLN